MRKIVDQVNRPFEFFGPKAWDEEQDARKFIKENMHHIVQNVNSFDEAKYGKGAKAAFRRVTESNSVDNGEVQFVNQPAAPDTVKFAVDYPDGSWLSVAYNPDRKFAKPQRDEAEKKSTIRVFVTNR